MNHAQLTAVLREHAEPLAVPGASAGVYVDGRIQLVTHGVTSVENPLEVDDRTLFQSGSIGKTFTATAMLRLVERGDVALDAPVRRYLPALRLRDEDTAQRVTIADLFNHTAGWEGDFTADTGNGDDALARFVERMAGIEQVTPLGSAVSYNNTSLCLAGRVIEVLTGATFEQAMADLVLTPLGLEHTFYFTEDVVTRRFCVGHQRRADGRATVMRPWRESRATNPAGGMCTTAADLLTWARFHLDDGRAADGTRVLSAELVQRMRVATVHMAGSALGDAVGISWFLRDVGGVRLVSHGGTTLGQHAALVLVPEQDVAVAVLANCSPTGGRLNRQFTESVLHDLLGIEDHGPEPMARAADDLAEYAGVYETSAAVCTITVEGGGLRVDAVVKPEVLAEMGVEKDDLGDDEPIPLGLVGATGDQYVVTDGPAEGMRGYFDRDEDGQVHRIHIGGRLAERVSEPVGATGETR